VNKPRPEGNWIVHVPPVVLILLVSTAIGWIKTTTDSEIERLESDLAAVRAVVNEMHPREK